MATQNQPRPSSGQPDNGQSAPGQPQGGLINAVIKLVVVYVFFMYMRSGKKPPETGSVLHDVFGVTRNFACPRS
jgi:hypothetical protein